MKIKIDNKYIGEDAPCFIIAEIGINHNNDLEIAKKLIDAASDAECDAIKLQTFTAESMYPKSAGKLEWQNNIHRYSYDIFQNVKKFEYPREWIKVLQEYCKIKNLILFSSVCDEESADFLEKAGMQLFKVTSYELTHIPLIEHIAKKNKPLIISTGGSTLDEIKESYNAAKKFTDKIILLHCITKYPTPLNKANLNIIETLKNTFKEATIGYSDHTKEPIEAPVAAVVKGAKVIEKHITLDKTMKGPDHFFAIEPEELKLMVKSIRETEEKLNQGQEIKIFQEILGSKERSTLEIEKSIRNFAYRTIFTTKEIKKGEIFTNENIAVLRRGKRDMGLSPKEYNNLIQGKVATKDLEIEHLINKEDII